MSMAVLPLPLRQPVLLYHRGTARQRQLISLYYRGAA
jgi:hypothetical protein